MSGSVGDPMTPRPATARRLRVLPVPETRPPILPPDEVFARLDASVIQDSLALDFATDQDAVFSRQFTPRRDLPDPRPLVERLAQAVVEVTDGLRPPTQLVRWTTPQVYAVLSRRAGIAGRRPPRQQRPAVVRRVRVQEPRDGVVEACAVVVHHDRVRALAMRLIGLDQRWIVTDLHIV